MFDQVTAYGFGDGKGQFENDIHGGIKYAILDLFFACVLSQSVRDVQIQIGGQSAGLETDGTQCDARKDESIVCLPGDATFAIIDNRRKRRAGAKQYTTLSKTRHIGLGNTLVYKYIYIHSLPYAEKPLPPSTRHSMWD